MSVAALVGAQFGSEGKGLIAGHVAREYRHHVRVGAANAGHTVYTSVRQGGPEYGYETVEYEKHVLQQIPCASYTNPDATCYIGPGAQIKPEIFVREIYENNLWRLKHGREPLALVVDHRAHIITPEHVQREAATDLAERIGSTSTIAREGIGTSQAARVMREDSCALFGTSKGLDLLEPHLDEWRGKWPQKDVGPGENDLIGDLPSWVVDDVPDALARVDGILLEGTQGYGLSLTTGHFPYVTSRNTTAAGLCADAGVAPTRLDRVIAVARTFPIRVAGNSGPFHPQSREITWDEIGVDEQTERTTVTKKVRRVATFSYEQVAEAVRINGATEIALTFADYIDPSIYGKTGLNGELIDEDHPTVAQMIARLERKTGIDVGMVGTGPHSVLVPTYSRAAA
jgi:adenylosuccinate synthase